MSPPFAFNTWKLTEWIKTRSNEIRRNETWRGTLILVEEPRNVALRRGHPSS